MLRNLIEKLNRVWYERSRVVPLLSIQKGAGTHRLLTIRDGILYLHSFSYSPKLENMQEIVLEDMTVNEVITTLSGMGYEAIIAEEASNEGLGGESALLALDITNRSIESGETVYAFTSNLWRVMYPIHRKIAEAENDLDTAVEQLLLPSAQGYWLDYWVGFLKIKRLPSESDEMLLRRALMTLTSVKSNNVAMEELISFYIGSSVGVIDYAPSTIEVQVSPEFMTTTQMIRDLIETLKGAGVEYFLNSYAVYSESYPIAFRSRIGSSFKESNSQYSKVLVELPRYEDDYSTLPPERALEGFTLGTSTLNSYSKLSVSDKRILSSVRMVMTLNGQVVQEM